MIDPDFDYFENCGPFTNNYDYCPCPDPDPPYEEPEFECGWYPEEDRCLFAGSEDCDFECPHRDEYLFFQELSSEDREKFLEGTVPDPI